MRPNFALTEAIAVSAAASDVRSTPPTMSEFGAEPLGEPRGNSLRVIEQRDRGAALCRCLRDDAPQRAEAAGDDDRLALHHHLKPPSPPAPCRP